MAERSTEGFPKLGISRSLMVLDGTIVLSAGLMLGGLVFVNGVEKVGSGVLTYFSGAIPKTSIVVDDQGQETKQVYFMREHAEAYQITLEDAFEIYRTIVLPPTLAAGVLAGVGLRFRS